MADSSTQAATSATPAVASPKSPTSPRSPRSPKSVSSPKSASSPPAADATNGEEQHLEVDNDRDVDELTINEQLSTYTASLSSSVLDYPMEHGRRYHAYQKGSYIFPNDDREQERLDVMHHMFVRTMGGRLWLAPIDEDKIHNVLDIGTGTGILAIEIADALPGAQVIGCDLSAIQSPWIPPNLKFEVDDVEQEWAYPSKFDFVMSRYMCGSLGDWPGHVKRIYENLAPGGWVELQDLDLKYRSDDGTLTPDHDYYKWNDLFLAGLDSINRDARPGPKLRSYAEAAGFINIREEMFKIPLGPWPKDPELKQIGLIDLVQLLDGLEGFSLKTLEALEWSRNEIEVFLASVRRDMKSGGFHAYAPFYVVYGQKPGGV